MNANTAEVSQQALLHKIVQLVRNGQNPWVGLFWALAESGLNVTPNGMNTQPTDHQLTLWLAALPGFPANKIDHRLRRIAENAAKGADNDSAMQHITGDFWGYIDDVRRALKK